MIPHDEEIGNLSFQQKDSTTENSPLDLVGWAGELKRKIASSEQETANLRSRAASLRTRSDVLLQMAQQSDAATKALRGLLHQVETTEVSIKPSALGRPQSSLESRKNLASQVRANAKVILKAAGRPLGRTEILAQLIEDGIVIPGANPAQRVGKILWQSEEFEYRNKGYWISGEPISQDVIPRKRYRAPNRRKRSS
ncbi:hypothetical protein [Rhizobium leguminosarum]|uniref:hypothetical protein n=1 Tax=Rhizobium leguminosarum TaxID=384 RepID=UPI001C9757D4|nr:hypothetical protein [Rhizobium leguminosarum]MBY5406148.1 hypothetical protein [Rhizobium leguminosarum]